MGAEFGIDHAPGTDLNKVFRDLQETARYEHGHGGYSGSIAEAAGVQLLQRTPLTLDAALNLANSMWDDPRVEKWGPALAIPVVLPTRDVRVTIKGYDHPSDYAKAAEYLKVVAADALSIQRKKRRGETVQSVWVESYTQPDTFTNRYYSQARPVSARRENVTLWVTVNKPKAALTPGRVAQAEPDGFVFFGCYSS